MKRFYLILFIFTYSVLGNDCAFNYFTHSKIDDEIAKYLQLDNSISSKLHIQNKVDIHIRLKDQNSEVLDRIQKILSETPENYMTLRGFSVDRLILDSYKRGYSALSINRAKRFRPTSPDLIWKVPSFSKTAKPTLLDQKYREIMVEINKFFSDQKTVFRHMQEFEDQVLRRSYDEYPNFTKLDEDLQNEIKQKHMVESLNELEVKHNFVSNNPKKYEALNLEDRTYSLDDWQQMLRDGKIFNDTNFKNAQKVSDIISRFNHGYFTHRIQWHILLKHIDLNPQLFHNIKGVDIFKKLGDKKFNSMLNMGKTSKTTLWQRLFDAINSRSYHSPEFFREMHELYPNLGAWL